MPESVQKGGALASEAASSMRQVAESAKKVANVIMDIEAASQEQSAGIEQINKAITQMDAITQEHAHMAQQLIATAERVRDQSWQMLAAISAFSIQAASAPRVQEPVRARTTASQRRSAQAA
jgi:methyl-accepting chemotaxis protein